MVSSESAPLIEKVYHKFWWLLYNMMIYIWTFKLQFSVTTNNDKKRGLTFISATLFIAGEMAGSGVLALPKAIVDTGILNGVKCLNIV